MVANQKVTGRAMSIPGGVILGAGIALLWTIAASGILAMLIDREMLAETSIGYGCMVILFSASMLGSFTAWGKTRRKRAIVCMSAGAAYFSMLLSMTALFFGAQYEAVGATAGMILAGCAIVTLMGMGQGKGHSRNLRKKYR